MYANHENSAPVHIIEKTKDPVAKFLGLQTGDMIECTCDSQTAGETIRYKICQ